MTNCILRLFWVVKYVFERYKTRVEERVSKRSKTKSSKEFDFLQSFGLGIEGDKSIICRFINTGVITVSQFSVPRLFVLL